MCCLQITVRGSDVQPSINLSQQSPASTHSRRYPPARAMGRPACTWTYVFSLWTGNLGLDFQHSWPTIDATRIVSYNICMHPTCVSMDKLGLQIYKYRGHISEHVDDIHIYTCGPGSPRDSSWFHYGSNIKHTFIRSISHSETHQQRPHHTP